MKRTRELNRLLPLIRPHRRALGLALVLLVVGTALGLVLPWVVRDLVDHVLLARQMRPVWTIIGTLFGVFILQALANAGQSYLLTRAGERLVADLRGRVYAHLQSLPVAYFAERRTGDLLSRLTSDVTLIQSALTGNLLQLLSQSLTVIGGIILMCVINWRLTLVAALVLPFVVPLGRLLGTRIRAATVEVQTALGETNAVAEEGLSNVRVVRAFAREVFEVGRYRAGVERTYQAGVRRARIQATLGPLIGLLGFSAVLIVFAVGSREVIAGRLTPGALISYLFYVMLVVGPTIGITNGYSAIQQALGGAERVFDILDAPPGLEAADDLPALPPVRGAVALDDVWFDYGNGPVLFGVSLAAAPGEVIALVGPSGAGKTTVANLLLRFADPTDGAVRVDGVDLRTVAPRSLRDQLAYVTQDVALFSGTVGDNIRYGRLDATDGEIAEAARAANAADFIAALPQGYDTVIGERGVKLSGGQRQRIAIARALLRDPRILILDEATSSLDTRAERAVQEALDRLMAGRTTVVIAHRLSTVERADRIYVLDHGRIVETGRHDALLLADGLYADLYARRAADDALGVGD